MQRMGNQGSPSHRWFRKRAAEFKILAFSSPSHRWFRNYRGKGVFSGDSSPSHRWFRNMANTAKR